MRSASFDSQGRHDTDDIAEKMTSHNEMYMLDSIERLEQEHKTVRASRLETEVSPTSVERDISPPSAGTSIIWWGTVFQW